MCKNKHIVVININNKERIKQNHTNIEEIIKEKIIIFSIMSKM